MEWYTTECGKYKIESISPRTFPGALSLIKREFCEEEVINIGTDVKKNPAAIEELLALCAYAALDGASLVAMATDTEEVVAVIFNILQEANGYEKTFFETFAEEYAKQLSSRAVVQFMADVDKECNMFDIYDIDCSLEMMFMATHYDHRRRNLGYLLCKFSLVVARKLKDGPVAHMRIEDLGFNYSNIKPRGTIAKYPKICQGLASARGTQKILQSLGFTLHLRFSLQEFMSQEKTNADAIGFESFCHVMSKPLYPNITSNTSKL